MNIVKELVHCPVLTCTVHDRDEKHLVTLEI